MSDELSPEEKAMRAAWTDVCMAEYRITGDMLKAASFADRIENTYKDAVKDAVRAEVLREAAKAIWALKLPQPSGSEPYRSGRSAGLEEAADLLISMANER